MPIFGNPLGWIFLMLAASQWYNLPGKFLRSLAGITSDLQWNQNVNILCSKPAFSPVWPLFSHTPLLGWMTFQDMTSQMYMSSPDMVSQLYYKCKYVQIHCSGYLFFWTWVAHRLSQVIFVGNISYSFFRNLWQIKFALYFPKKMFK
jgi:hypothetical protein